MKLRIVFALLLAVVLPNFSYAEDSPSMKVTRLGRFPAKLVCTESESGWHQRLGDLFTRIAAGEESLGKS